MKKTIIKCAVFSFSLFVLAHIIATLAYFKVLNDIWMFVLLTALLVAALPAYFFVKRDEGKLFIYPITMTVFAALNFLLCCVAFVVLSDNNIIGGWDSLVYLIGWFELFWYFILVLAIDFIIATVARIKAHIFKKNNNE